VHKVVLADLVATHSDRVILHEVLPERVRVYHLQTLVLQNDNLGQSHQRHQVNQIEQKALFDHIAIIIFSFGIFEHVDVLVDIRALHGDLLFELVQTGLVMTFKVYLSFFAFLAQLGFGFVAPYG